MEAHGGYSFCGLAALVLLGKEHLCDIQALLVRFFLLFCMYVCVCVCMYVCNVCMYVCEHLYMPLLRSFQKH